MTIVHTPPEPQLPTIVLLDVPEAEPDDLQLDEEDEMEEDPPGDSIPQVSLVTL